MQKYSVHPQAEDSEGNKQNFVVKESREEVRKERQIRSNQSEEKYWIVLNESGRQSSIDWMIHGGSNTELVGTNEHLWAQMEMIQLISEGFANGREGEAELNGKLLDPGLVTD